jgi:glycosyltransferase involved in cell wall biosynthesis
MPSDPSRHVVLVAHDIQAVGGMERQLTELIRGLLARGWRVTVVSRTLHLRDLPGLRWLRVRGPSRPFPIAYPWFFLAAAVRLRRAEPGIVHTTGALAAVRADVSTVHLCHAAIRERAPLARVSRAGRAYRLNAAIASRLSRLAERWCYSPRRARRLVGVSEGVSAEVERHLPDTGGRVRTVQNGVDPDLFRPRSGDDERAHPAAGPAGGRLTALFVGGEWEGKGLRVAMEAIARSPEWRLVVVGRGDSERYTRIAAELGIAERVRFAGPVVDVAPVYRAADAFLLPTAYETFSLVTYEAAASGLPLLVSRVSGVEELLEPDVNGWFVARDPADIAARLEALARDPELRERLGHAARAASLRFSWDAMVDGYVAVYEELASAPAGTLDEVAHEGGDLALLAGPVEGP